MIKGIFVNENGCIPYAELIVRGLKKFETRNRDMLSALVGERVAIIRTRRGKKPMVVGFATIRYSFFCSADKFESYRDVTLIPENSSYDCHGKGKWLYSMDDPYRCEQPIELPSSAIRHGRSWCEFCY